MKDYRRGAVLGLTVAETFILLTFLLLIALLGLIQRDEPPPKPDTAGAPGVWVRPDRIETLQNAATEARRAEREAKEALATAEHERDQAREGAKQARTAEREAKEALATAEHERDQVREGAEQAHTAEREAKEALADAERERDRARERAGQARVAENEAKRALADAAREREAAQRNLALIRRKGENPPCWYRIVSAGEGKTREKPYYLFNVAIYEGSIELAPRTPPPGGAVDDDGGRYADEWRRLRVAELPYGRALSDSEFIRAVGGLVAQGRNRQVRTYECVFSVMVWDKTPDHAKKRWKYAHDRIIEGSFSAYTAQNLEWKGHTP